MKNQAETDYTSNYNQKSIVIIGAGPCGILSVKHLKDKHNVICYDNRSDIGGQWQFDSLNESNHPNLQKNSFYKQYGVLPSSLYENLQANIPKQLMTFKDFPTKDQYDEFMKSEQFFEYLQDYCSHFNLKKRMMFNSYVSSVRLTKNLAAQEKQQAGFNITKRFLVQVTSADDHEKDVRYLQADSVIVSNGHCSVPNYPKIKGLEQFKGKSLHMHYFRKQTMSEFKDKHLVIYGCSLSAQDVVYMLLKKYPVNMQPKKITVIGNEEKINQLKQSQAYNNEFSQNKLAFVSPYIKEFNSDRSLILETGEKVENIDFFLQATGYVYYYPFFNKIDNLIDIFNKNGRANSIGPLYKRMFCVNEPNLIFLGAIQGSLAIQQCYERQTICASKFLNGEVQLPPYEQMQEEFKNEYEESLSSHPDGRDYLKVSLFAGLNELEYVAQLSELTKIPVDEEFNSLVLSEVVPLYINTMFKGDYALLKSQKVAHKFPANYFPRTGFL